MACGTVLLLPHDMQIELGVALQFIDNPATGQRSSFSKVPFFRELGNDDMIAIGCKLKHHKAFPPPVNDHSKQARESYIMREGDRGCEMWIIVEGIVHVERSSGSEDSTYETLGKLREGDCLGELAVIAQERPGVHFKRTRSAYACSSRAFAMLYALTYRDLQELRQNNPQIDVAIHAAAQNLRKHRPSLFATDDNATAVRAVHGGPDRNAGIDAGVAALAARVESLETEVRSGMSTMRDDITNLQSSIDEGIAKLHTQLEAALRNGE